MVIKDGRVQINRKTGRRIIRQFFAKAGVDIDTTLTGPTYFQLHRTGKVYIGSTVRPVVVSLDGMLRGDEINGNLKNRFTAKVKGKRLQLKIAISGRLLGEKLNGQITAICKRER